MGDIMSSQLPPSVATEGKKGSILIVDDDPEITESFGLVLEDSGLFLVEKFTDPMLALSNFKPDTYDLLF